MEQKNMPKFIVIDDDNINNLICVSIIRHTIPEAAIETFTDPQEGLDYISSAFSDSNANDAVLFLDINMPVLNGWDVLDRVRKLPELIRKHIKIFMLSSSVDPVDEAKANDNPLVSGFVTKSMSQVKLLSLFPEYGK